jgi:A/G-specific adenine glycosylase
MIPSHDEVIAFQKTVYDCYSKHKRMLPWRDTTDPYRILVSEVMLQQTQVLRAISKYDRFLDTFPTIQALSQASIREVLTAWQGLGYNRRALCLHRLAGEIVARFNASVPVDREDLMSLPGIGVATAGAICAFAFNRPVVFIETNIRTVYLFHFFSSRSDVHDKEILPLVEVTLDNSSPREWYWALMDYGVFLKGAHGNPGRKSAHLNRQSRFEGSDRQIRGRILRFLVGCESVSEKQLVTELAVDLNRIESILNNLEKEGFIARGSHRLSLRDD